MRGAALASLLLAACYAPNPQPGAPCANGTCPSGLVCSPATNTCERTAVDAPSVIRDAADVDAALIDATMVVPPDAQACFGTGLLNICLATLPSSPVHITSFTAIDTGSSNQCVAYTGTNPGAYCVIAGTSITVDASRKLRGTGTRPLVLLSTSTITIDGTVDVATGGAGANPAVCVAGGTPGASEGGPGGSFTGVGGSGGGKVTGLGPAGAAATSTPAVRGGCPGGAGNGVTPGAGGAGGGAVYLIAASTLTVNGTITAAGALGKGGAAGGGGGGGGGGGAGGFIGLDAPTVTVATTGAVFANGGGGGEGATPNQLGLDGAASAGPTTAGAGGADNAPHGGNGGAGSLGASRAGAAGEAGGTCGMGASAGGGGGGAAGMIYVFPAQALGGQVSPPPT